jgi:hypothetical protein
MESGGRDKEATMALSIQELELQTAEFLPAREVMTGCGCRGGVTINDNDGNHNGNAAQFGLLNINALNGNANGNTVVLGGGF